MHFLISVRPEQAVPSVRPSFIDFDNEDDKNLIFAFVFQSNTSTLSAIKLS